MLAAVLGVAEELLTDRATAKARLSSGIRPISTGVAHDSADRRST